MCLVFIPKYPIWQITLGCSIGRVQEVVGSWHDHTKYFKTVQLLLRLAFSIVRTNLSNESSCVLVHYTDHVNKLDGSVKKV